MPTFVPLVLLAAAVGAQSNLPELRPGGVFTVSARTEINATIDSVWNAITDFPNYPKWNPFVRSAVIVDQLMVPAPVNQQSKPQENNRISFRVQIPPLPLPVNESTPDVALNTQYSLENITHVQKDVYRIAWKYLFVDALIDAERWSAISVQNGVSVYESREIYYGALSPLVKSLFGTGLQQAFEAQGAALKLLLEK